MKQRVTIDTFVCIWESHRVKTGIWYGSDDVIQSIQNGAKSFAMGEQWLNMSKVLVIHEQSEPK